MSRENIKISVDSDGVPNYPIEVIPDLDYNLEIYTSI